MEMETMMITIQYEAAEKLATDIRSTHTAIDEALSNIASLTTSMIDVCRASDVPPATSQAAIEYATLGLTKLVDARKGFVAAHRKIAMVQKNSNLQEVSFGCTGPGPITQPRGRYGIAPTRPVLRVVNS
jgi:hypothetical protein